jgi:hypothetical protein
MDLIEELGAKEAIRQVANRYCRGVDRLDVAMMASAYHDGAIDDHGVFVGDAAEFCQRVVKTHARFDATMHCIFNHTIELDDDTHARGELYNTSYLLRTLEDGNRELDTWWGRYVDRYELRDGRWAITHRICVHEWTKTDPIERAMTIPAELFKQGGADRATGAGLGPDAFLASSVTVAKEASR